ncbi:helix-turn-helix domain-containing protein [Sphingomonas sp. PB2P19]|uniref:winged helix-turn-helix transcriptional regulator n=1 Tax=Sphingomonas rhamnosi TaxID=3096156 RepID=UPI002FC68B89
MDMPAPTGVTANCRRMSSVLSLVGDKWTVMIVMVLIERPRRFNDIKRTIGGISQQMLTRTLKALDRDGMVNRTVHPTVPPQVEYALTELGYSLAEPLRALGAWAGAHLEEIDGNRVRYDTVRDGELGKSASDTP